MWEDFDLTPDSLDQLIKHIQELLGEVYTSLAETDRRGQAAKGTPPKRRHRLMVLVEQVRRAAHNLRKGHRVIDITAVTELEATYYLLDRWRNDPAWPGIIRSLKNPDDFPHTLVMLGAASALLDRGRTVRINLEETPNKRAADLELVINSSQSIPIEVKAPQALQRVRAGASLSAVAANTIVYDAYKMARRGTGQLRIGEPGMLVIGGFPTTEDDLTPLIQAAHSFFADPSARRKDIVGIFILLITVLGVGPWPEITPDRVVVVRQAKFRPLLRFRLVLNPHYAGPIRLDFGETGNSAADTTARMQPFEERTRTILLTGGSVEE